MYNLVNPYIKGGQTTSFVDPSDAWKSISKSFSNNVPKFAFSLERTSDKKLFHYSVKEEISEAGVVTYKIKEMDLKLNDKNLKAFRGKLNNFINGKSTSGGKRKRHKREKKDEDDSSSSSSSCSDNIFRKLANRNRFQNQPLMWWWYDPYIYQMDSFYVPTFVPSYYPYFQVSSSIYYPLP